jgi:hypothetical protein
MFIVKLGGTSEQSCLVLRILECIFVVCSADSSADLSFEGGCEYSFCGTFAGWTDIGTGCETCCSSTNTGDVVVRGFLAKKVKSAHDELGNLIVTT